MSVMFRCRESVHCGGGRVIAKDFGHDVLQNTLAVTPWPINEQQGVLTGVAGEAVAGPALNEPLQLLITSRCLGEELQEQWTIGRRCRGSGCELGNEIFFGRRFQRAGSEVDRAAGSPEQERIAIPNLGSRSKSLIAPRHRFDALSRLSR